jgi:dienelactone hydrolase
MKLKIITIFFLLVTSSLHAEELVKLETRTGVEQRFILIKPEKPVASVILFAGGKGALDLSSLLGSPTINWGKNNFLVRTRDLFAKNNFIVAVVDAPSDKQTKKGMLGGFRDSQEHVEDIDKVIDYLRKQANVPVWLIGTSRGTESATNIAIHSNKQPYGLVLTSSMSVSNPKGTSINDMDLEKIQIPTLLVANTDDGCNKTPPEGAQEIADKLISSKKVEVKMFSGGDRPISKPCNAMSHHGFLGIENSVVDYISTFIKSN